MWHDKLRRGSGVVDERIGGGGGGGKRVAVRRRQRGEEGCVEAAYNIYTNECFSGTGERVECTLCS